MLQSSGVRVRTEDMIQVEDLHEHQGLYEEQVKEAREFVESKLSEMNAVLDGNIARLNEQVMRCMHCTPKGSAFKLLSLSPQVAQIVSQLCTGNFINADGYDDPDAVLEELEAIKHKLENVEALSKQYSSNQVRACVYIHSIYCYLRIPPHVTGTLWSCSIQLQGIRKVNTCNRGFVCFPSDA